MTSLIVNFALAQDETINDALVNALEISARPNPSTRTAEPLISFFQHSGAMNETELYGSLKAVLHNTSSGLAVRDSVLLEYIRHVVRFSLHRVHTEMVQARL